MTEATTWGDILKPIIKSIKDSVSDIRAVLAFKPKDPEPTLTRSERAFKDFMEDDWDSVPDRVEIPDPSILMSVEEELNNISNMVITDRRRGRPPVFNTPKTKGVLYVCMEAASDEYLEVLNRKGYEVRDIKDMPR